MDESDSRRFLITVALSIVITLMAPLPLEGQASSPSPRRIIVFPSNGEALGGRLLQIDAESITLLTTKSEQRIPFSDINRVILGVEGRGHNRGALMGAVLGGYLSTLIFSRNIDGSRSEYGHFMPAGPSWLLFAIVTLPGILCGGGIGYLVDSGSNEEEQLFDFTGSEESKTKSREELLKIWKGDDNLPLLHISVYAGQVSRAVTDQHGYPVPTGSYGSGVSAFNLLRRVQGTYSIIPEAQVGVSLVWFGEPKKYSYKYEYSGTSSRNANMDQSFDAFGTYAVGVFKPLGLLSDGKLKSQFDCSLGLGLGSASSDYTLNSFVGFYDYTLGTSTEQRTTISFSERFMSGIFFIDLGLILQDNLTIGFSFDQVLGPARQLPSIPEAGFPQKTLKFGNSSYGFNIGVHF